MEYLRQSFEYCEKVLKLDENTWIAGAEECIQKIFNLNKAIVKY